MSRMASMVRGGALSGMAVFVSMAALLAVAKMLTNALPQSQAGLFFLLLLCADFLNLAFSQGLNVSLPKLVAGAAPEARPRMVSANLSGVAVVGGVVAALVVALWLAGPPPAWLPRAGQAADLWPYLWLVAPLFLTGMLRDTAMAAHAGLHAYGRRAAAIVTASAVQVALVFALVWLWGGGLTVMTLCTAGAYALAVAWLLAALPEGRGLRADWGLFRDSVRFSRPLYVNNLLNFAFQRFDTMLVALLLGGAQIVAIYEIAKRFPIILSRALNAALVPFLPNVSSLLADGRRGEAARLLDRTLALTAFLGYLGVLTVVLLQEPLIVLLSNRDYLEGARVVGLLTAAICVAVQTGLLGQTLIALGRPVYVTLSNVLTAVISVAANCLLIPLLGVTGAGVAALLAALAGGALHIVFLRRQAMPLNLLACAKPQLIMAAACGCIVLPGGALPARLGAWVLFLALSLLFGVVRPRELWQMGAAILRRSPPPAP